MSEGRRAYVQPRGDGDLRWFGRTSTRFLATGESTDGAFCLVDERATRGESVPLHRHVEDMESFYVLEGEVAFFLGEEPGEILGPGGFVHVPGGAVHGFRIESEAARYLIFTTPHHGEFYRAISLPSGPGGSPPDKPIESAQIKEASQQYGIEFVGPLPEAD